MKKTLIDAVQGIHLSGGKISRTGYNSSERDYGPDCDCSSDNCDCYDGDCSDCVCTDCNEGSDPD